MESGGTGAALSDKETLVDEHRVFVGALLFFSKEKTTALSAAMSQHATPLPSQQPQHSEVISAEPAAVPVPTSTGSVPSVTGVPSTSTESNSQKPVPSGGMKEAGQHPGPESPEALFNKLQYMGMRSYSLIQSHISNGRLLNR